jgi:hypothetical protein
MEGQREIEDKAELTDEQKRRLRAVRRGYRAESVEVKDSGWLVEVKYLDGSVIHLNSKLLKLKAKELQSE